LKKILRITELDDDIIRLYKEGLSDEEVAAQLGFSRSTMQRYRSSIGIVSKKSNGYLESKCFNCLNAKPHMCEKVRVGTKIYDEFVIGEEGKVKVLECKFFVDDKGKASLPTKFLGELGKVGSRDRSTYLSKSGYRLA
jgi:hypothetical protein